MRSRDEIVALYRERVSQCSQIHKAALDVRAAFYGDVTIPLPELDRQEKPLVANFVYSMGSQMAMRVASTMPNVFYPSTDPGSPRADQRGRQRRLVNMAWWDQERMKIKLRKRARHMVYYADSPVMLTPDFKKKRPSWKTRNPLATFVPIMDEGDVTPSDVIFTYPKSIAWLYAAYPFAAEWFGDPKKVVDGRVTILEYQDEFDTVLCAIGERVNDATRMYGDPTRVEVNVELDRLPNRLGRCACVIARGVGLDHARGIFDGSIGMWQSLGKLMALETIGMERAVWPEMWLTDDPNSDGATIVTHADPLHGIMGHVTGGSINTIHPLPEAFGGTIMDRIERFGRIDSGSPSELGGESGSNIRTGRRGDQILSAVLDFPMQEMQELLAVSLQEENRVAAAIDKAYFPTAKSIYVSATAGEIEYEATKLWEDDTNFVAYTHAGVDEQGLVIEIGQRVGVGTMSKRSAMESDPLIEDPQGEFDRMTGERLDDALLQGLQAMAQDPSMAPVVAKVAIQARVGEIEIPEAVLAVHEAIQEQQQAQAQAAQQAQMGAGAPPGAEAQPGMAQPIPSIAQGPAGLQNLTQILTQLRRGSTAAVPNALGIAS